MEDGADNAELTNDTMGLSEVSCHFHCNLIWQNFESLFWQLF